MAISETEGSLRKNDDDRRRSLIDVSSSDDSLVMDNDRSEDDESLRSPNSRKFGDAASKIQLWEQEPQRNEIENSKSNSRRSFAWDKAFFTSAGVLNPEELNIIIEGAVKDEKRVPPLQGIREDVHKSCESISTFESDNLSLESLEADLFVELRHSIEKSSKKSNLAPASANCKVPSGFQTGSSSKKIVASYNKAPSSKSQGARMQGIGKITKDNPVSPQHPKKPVARRAETSILKQPKVGKSNPSSRISSKRASLGDTPHVKSEKDKAKQIIGGKVNSVTNTPAIKGSRVTAPSPKPTVLSKSPADLPVANKTKFISPSSRGNLSGNIDKSPLNSSKRKVAPATKKPLPCFVGRTPSEFASREKNGSSKSSLSSSLSVTKLSCISSASSTSNMSPISSSSSTSTARHRSNSSCRKGLSDIYAGQGSSSQNYQSHSNLERKGTLAKKNERKESEKSGLTSQRLRTAASGVVLAPAPKRPSGRQQPSPKIGFFDGVKSSVHTPQEGTRRRPVVSRSSPKHGVGNINPNKGQTKTGLGKVQPKKSTIPVENKKINNQKTLHRIPLHKSADAVTKRSMVLQHVKSTSVAPREVQNKLHLKLL